MARRFPPEVHHYIAENVEGRTARELAAMVSAEFGIEFTESAMKSYKANHKLQSGTPCGIAAGAPSKLFPAEVIEYIRAHYKGCGPKEMAERLNRQFQANYTRTQITAYYKNHHLNSGTDGRFQKGHISHNKGKKGVCASGSEKGHFRKGSLPHNTKPIGWEREREQDGYIEVKVRMRPSRKDCNDNFVMKHRLIYEQTHGPIPADCVVIFKDGNKRNFDPENLVLITKAERLEMSRRGLFSENPEITEIGITVAKVRTAIYKKQKQKFKAGERGAENG